MVNPLLQKRRERFFLCSQWKTGKERSEHKRPIWNFQILLKALQAHHLNKLISTFERFQTGEFDLLSLWSMKMAKRMLIYWNIEISLKFGNLRPFWKRVKYTVLVAVVVANKGHHVHKWIPTSLQIFSFALRMARKRVEKNVGINSRLRCCEFAFKYLAKDTFVLWYEIQIIIGEKPVKKWLTVILLIGFNFTLNREFASLTIFFYV